ncbi:MAG: MFS transporter [Chloroflexi bacterium]|nr:MFS transporter [Chloroflexota bacterium]
MSDPGSAWALPTFRLFLVARAISWTGNAVTLVALPLLVFQLTGSPAMTGLVAALEALPYLMIGLLAGALVDRWDRKRVMILTGLGSGAALGAIPLLDGLGMLAAWQVLVAAAIVSTLWVFFDAASFGAVPEMVGRPRIASAQSAMTSVSTLTMLLGPAVGGVLVAAVSAPWAIGLDALAYVVAAILTARVHWTRHAADDRADQPRSTLRADIAEGIRFIWTTRIVRLLTIVGAGASISGGAMLGLTVVVGIEHLGMDEDGSEVGLLYAATALGALLAALAVHRVQDRVPTGRITIAALAISGLAQVAWAVVSSIAIGLAVLVVFQGAATLSIINGIVVRQTMAPMHLQSRVNTTARMIAWGGTPLGAGLGGLLAEHLDLSAAIIICSGGTLVGLLVALLTSLRSAPRLAVLAAAPAGPLAHMDP